MKIKEKSLTRISDVNNNKHLFSKSSSNMPRIWVQERPVSLQIHSIEWFYLHCTSTHFAWLGHIHFRRNVTFWLSLFYRIQNARMNGEIPSVPITTLAGIASLTDRKQICYQKLYLEVWIDVVLFCNFSAARITRSRSITRRSALSIHDIFISQHNRGRRRSSAIQAQRCIGFTIGSRFGIH